LKTLFSFFGIALAAWAGIFLVSIKVEERKEPLEQPVFYQESKVFVPIKNFYTNQTEKPFGVFVSDRFRGFHTGADIEVKREDLTRNVPVYAIAEGLVVEARFASGYGGVVAIAHQIGQDKLFGVYGHLRLSSLNVRDGQKVKAGQLIGYLGRGFSPETDGVRKHLHFGLYKGKKVNILGYVENKEDLKNWINPTEFLRRLNANPLVIDSLLEL